MAHSPSSVAIIMRTRERGLLLRRALADVAAQTYPHWQLVIVNDGGPREDVEGLLAEAALDGRVTVLHNDRSLGRAVSWNRGIEASRSDYITVHDDDDTWHPAFLERTVRHLDTTEDVGVAVRTEIVWEHVEGDRLVEHGREILWPDVRAVTLFDLLRINRFVPISILYRRSVHDDIGPVRSDLPVVEDWEFNMRLAASGPCGFLDGEPLAFWHQRREAEGALANSVIAVLDEHRVEDLRVRDEALREYVHRHGLGSLLYVTKYFQSEIDLVHERVTYGEGRLHEMVDLLHRNEERSNRQADVLAGLDKAMREQAELLSHHSEQVGRLEMAISDASLVSLLRRRYRRLKDRVTRRGAAAAS